MSANDRERLQKAQSREQETTQAQSYAQREAQQASPLVDMQDGGAEIFDRLTKPDLESDRYEGLEDIAKPYLSKTQMLADHDTDEYYDDPSRELLNTNLAERLTKTRERGRLLTGPFLEVAQDVEHEKGVVTSRPMGPTEKEALREALVNVRTDRQSLGDGKFLESVTEMHVSSEVRREDEPTDSGGGGILSTINPF